MVTNANVTKLEIPHIHWWLILLEGIAAIVVGILILAAPGISALALTSLLGVYWFVSGIFSLVSIFTNRVSWGWKLVSGILGIVAGLVVLQYPMWSSILVPAVIGAVLGIDGILIGVMRLVMAYRGAGWGVGLLGVVSILLGFVLLLFPPLAILTAIYTFAFVFLAGGITAFFAGLSLRRVGEVSVMTVPAPLAPASIPVTGNAPVPFSETEHEREETGEYSGKTGERGANDPPGPVPVTGRAPEAPYVDTEHEGEETGEYTGEPHSDVREHKPEEHSKYPGDDEYGEEM